MRPLYKIVITLVIIVIGSLNGIAQYNIEKELGSRALGLTQFSFPSAVVSGPDGSFYIADQSTLYKFTGSGNVIKKWTISNNQYILKLTLDKNNNVLALGSFGRVIKLNSDLEVIKEFGDYGPNDGQFQQVIDIDSDENNNVYVFDRIYGPGNSQGIYRVQIFDSEGNFISKPIVIDGGYYNSDIDYYAEVLNNLAVGAGKIVVTGWNYGYNINSQGKLKIYSISGTLENNFDQIKDLLPQFGFPNSASFDLEGNILVSDFSKVMKLSSNGVYQSHFELSTGPFSYRLLLDISAEPDGNLLVVDQGSAKIIERVTSAGSSLAKFGEASGAGQFKQPMDVAKDSQGNIYVVDNQNFRIQKFDSNGNYLLQFGNQGPEVSDFNSPRAIEIDSHDNIYILDLYKISKFDSNGTFIQSYESNRGETIRFDYIVDFKLDIEDNIYVLNSNFNDVAEVQKFDNTGRYIEKFGQSGNNVGELTGVVSLAIGPSGEIHINDFSNNLGGYRVQTFDRNGGYITTTPAGIYCQDLEVDGLGNLYGRSYNTVFRIEQSGPLNHLYSGGIDFDFNGGGLFVEKSSRQILATGQTSNNVIVLVCSPPTPSFSVVPGAIGDNTSFLDQSTNVSPNASYKWNFGDGTESTSSGNVEHVYAEARDYIASLTIDQACISRFSKTVSLVKSIVSDSVAMIDFYNKLNGPNWINKSNWLTGDFKTWSGLEFENDRLVGIHFEQTNNLTGELPASIKMLDKLKRLIISKNSLTGSLPEWLSSLTEFEEINLSDNQITGTVPSSLLSLQNLRSIILSGNELSQLPDLSTIPSLQTLAIENNRLSFEDIEPNVNITGFSYTPQKNINVQLNAETYLGGELVISPSIGGTANLYQWYKDGNAIVGATSLVYSKTNSQDSDAGDYYLQVTSTLVSDLTIKTTTITVTLATPPDNDGDGSNVLLDCNDNDATIFPGAPELCDSKDNNCDGIIDNGCVSTELWGLTKFGGPGKAGTIFSISADGGNALKLQYSFFSTLRTPSGGLLALPDSSILVTAGDGGIENFGGISRIDKNEVESTIFTFNQINGNDPIAALINGNDGWLYGTTTLGGSYYNGTIYKIRKDGSEHTVIYEFKQDGNGGYPFGSLLLGNDNLLYGVAIFGGATNEGLIFKIDKSGSNYQILHSFQSASGVGAYGSLIQLPDGLLYGITDSGGNFNLGTIFRLNSDGTEYETLHHFNGQSGSYPSRKLLYGLDGALYGFAPSGGLNNKGVLFKVNTDGANFSVIHNFNGLDGETPFGALLQKSDGTIIGSTINGGNYNRGVLFKINPDGSEQSVIHHFSPTDGQAPIGDLVLGYDNYIYGITVIGGTTNSGTVFKFLADGTNFNTIHSYGNQFGTNPIGNLIKANDGTIIGTTSEGGYEGSGTMFKINSDGLGYEVIHNFGFQTLTGARPNGLLIIGKDNFIYGTTLLGGQSYAGTIFRMRSNGSELSVLHTFDYSKEFEANGIIEGTDGVLYGTTKYGGIGNAGVIYKINKDGSSYSILHSFNGLQGSNPVGSLVHSKNGYLYGMTQYGGEFGYGIVFKINPDGSSFSIVHNFDYASGANPIESLTEADNGIIYGMAEGGGLSGAGTLFKIESNDSFSIIHNFNFQDGSRPSGSLTNYKNKLFGYTAYGGQFNGGVVFSYDLNSNQFTKTIDLNDFTGKNPLSGKLLLVNPENIDAPTTPSSNIAFADVTNNSMTINFQPGDGEKRVVLMAEYSENLPQVNIMDGTELSGNSDFSNATEYQTGWKVISSGTQSSINVTGLKGSVTYVVTVIEYNGATIETRYLNQNAPIASQKTLPDLLTPTIASSNITFNAVSYTSMHVSFTHGNGEQRIVVMNEGSASSFIPADNITYSGELENGERIVYSGSGNTFQASELISNTIYYFTIFEFNSAEGQTKYLTSGAPVAYQNTKPEVFAPTIAAANINFTNVTPNSLKVTFSPGNGEQRLAVMKQGSAPTFIPADDNFYSGSQNSEEFFVYNGSGNSFELSGLEPNSIYYLKIFEFNTDSIQTRYLTNNTAENNKRTAILPNVYVINPADGSIQNKVKNLSITANKVDKAKKYTIQISTLGNFSDGVITKSGSRTLTFSGLMYNTRYYARVKTDLSPFYGKVTSFDTSPAFDFAYVISPKDGAKNVETSLKVSANPLNSINPLARATTYTIELNTSPGFDGTSIIKTSSSPDIQFNGLSKNTTYYTRVLTDISMGYWGKTTRFTTGNKSSSSRISADDSIAEVSDSLVFEVTVLENPFKHRLSLIAKTKEVEDIVIKLTDMTGKTITHFTDKSNHEIIIDKPMQQGMYLLYVRAAANNKILRVIKIE